MEELKFNSQVCTSIEQSKRLLGLGLKPETADMVSVYEEWGNYWRSQTYQWETYNETDIDNFIPAWSLHRLKCLLPNKIPYESGYLTTEIINNVNLMFITDTSEQRLISFIHENLYESIIKCIKWFIKEGYFNKQYLNE